MEASGITRRWGMCCNVSRFAEIEGIIGRPLERSGGSDPSACAKLRSTARRWGTSREAGQSWVAAAAYEELPEPVPARRLGPAREPRLV